MAAQADLTVVTRLSNLGAWEMYRAELDEHGDVVCTVGLLPSTDAVEFALFAGSQKDATVSSRLRRDKGAWSDVSREGALRSVLDANAHELPNLTLRALVFAFSKGSEPNNRAPSTQEAESL